MGSDDRSLPHDGLPEAAGEASDTSCRKRCPACGSRRLRVVIPAGTSDSLLKFSNFKVFQDRECKDCGRRWTPPCPRWGAYCCIAAGLFLLALTVAAMLWFLGENEIRGAVAVWLLPGLPALFALVYGVGTLRGKLGQLTMR